MPPVLRRVVAEPRAVIGGAIMLLVLFVALAAPYLAPHDPAEQDLLRTLLPPAWLRGGDRAFPLGTDSLGRCTLSQLLFGARVAMKVALAAAGGAALLGASLALICGYFGGAVDWLISRAIDVWMSFPPVVLSLIFMVGFGAGLGNVILAIIIVDWTRFCRIVRSEVLTVTRRDYVPAPQPRSAAGAAGRGHRMTLLEAAGLPLAAELGGGTVPVLRDVGFVLRPGRVLGLVGESGAGKTMIGRIIGQLLPTAFRVTAGSLKFRGEDLLRLPPDRHRALLGDRIAFVPQEPLSSLNPVLTIGQQFDEHLKRLGVGRRTRRGRATSLLAEVRLPDPAR